MSFDYRTLTFWSLGCGIIMTVTIRLQVRRVLRFEPELAPDAPRFCRSFELLWFEAVLFNALMAYVVRCGSPFHSLHDPTTCAILPLIAHTLLALELLWWAWKTDGPELVVKFEDIGSFGRSTSEVRWGTTLAAVGSLAGHVYFRAVGI